MGENRAQVVKIYDLSVEHYNCKILSIGTVILFSYVPGCLSVNILRPIHKMNSVSIKIQLLHKVFVRVLIQKCLSRASENKTIFTEKQRKDSFVIGSNV